MISVVYAYPVNPIVWRLIVQSVYHALVSSVARKFALRQFAYKQDLPIKRVFSATETIPKKSFTFTKNNAKSENSFQVLLFSVGNLPGVIVWEDSGMLIDDPLSPLPYSPVFCTAHSLSHWWLTIIITTTSLTSCVLTVSLLSEFTLHTIISALHRPYTYQTFPVLLYVSVNLGYMR